MGDALTQARGGKHGGRQERDEAFAAAAHRGSEPSLTDAIKAVAAEPYDDAMRGVELLSEWIATRKRRPQMPLSEEIRRAARVGCPLARRIVRDGMLGGLDELQERQP